MSYQDHLPVLKLIALKYSKPHIPPDELLSIANKGFIKAAQNYVPDKSGFKTWVITKVKGEILNHMKINNNFNKHINYKANINLSTKYVCQEKTVIFWQMLEQCTTDAKFIINLILNPPQQFSALVKARGNGTTTTNLETIREYLTQECKWSYGKVAKNFKIIKTMLQSIAQGE